MRALVFLLIFSFAFNAMASDCRELLRPFYQAETFDVDINLEKYGLKNTIEDKAKFQKLYAQCLSPHQTDAKDLASKKLSNIFFKMSALTTVVGYSSANWDKKKDMDWFERLGYTLVFGALVGKIYSKVIKNKGNKFHFLIKDYIFGRAAVISWFGGNLILFNDDKANIEKINQLKNSKTFEADIKKLNEYIENKQVLERFQREVIEQMINVDQMCLGVGQYNEIDFDHLRPEDLDNKDVQEVILAAMAKAQYDNMKGPIHTGNGNVDFYLYDSLYSILKIPKDIFVGKMTNKLMCLHQFNPKKGLTMAVGLNTLNLILFADFYGVTYKVLKKELLVGQN